jgi:tetratricopeptide (TPR) repeat protein
MGLHPKTLPRFVAAAVTVALLQGCPRPPDEPAPRIMELEPIYFTVSRTGDRIVVKSRQENDIFEDARKDFETGHFTRAKTAYAVIARDGTDPAASGTAWFNIALCELALGQPGAALAALDTAEPLVPEISQEVHVLQVQAAAMSGDWKRARAVGEPLLQTQLPPLWTARVHSYVGEAFFVEQDFPAAARHFDAAVTRVLNTLPPSEQKSDALLASAYYRQALVYRALFARIRLKLPTERMTLDLTDKLGLMRKAEEQFLAAVRVRNSEWSPKAGYESARLYESFAQDLLDAEVPTDLGPEELQVYTEELNAKVVPVLRRAQEILRRNIGMCDQFQFPGDWKSTSQARIDAIQAVVDRLEPKK